MVVWGRPRTCFLRRCWTIWPFLPKPRPWPLTNYHHRHHQPYRRIAEHFKSPPDRRCYSCQRQRGIRNSKVRALVGKQVIYPTPAEATLRTRRTPQTTKVTVHLFSSLAVVRKVAIPPSWALLDNGTCSGTKADKSENNTVTKSRHDDWSLSFSEAAFSLVLMMCSRQCHPTLGNFHLPELHLSNMTSS